MNSTEHLFMPGHTIAAAIKLHNHHDVLNEELVELLRLFDEMNGLAPIRPGQRCLIPLLDRHQA